MNSHLSQQPRGRNEKGGCTDPELSYHDGSAEQWGKTIKNDSRMWLK